MLEYNNQHMFCTQNENKSPNTERNNFVHFVGAFLAIIITTSGGFYVWDRYISEMGQARRFAAEQAAALEKAESAYVKAMTEDTYGGKTPQETLDLFVSALKAGDVDLASKYFLLKEEENFSEEKIWKKLNEIKESGFLNDLARDIATAVEYKFIDDKNINFVIYNTSGTDSLLINFRFNEFSNIWKIVNFFD